MRLVLQPAESLLRNVGQLCLGVFFLILVERHRRRDFAERNNQWQHVHQYDAASEMTGDLDRLVEGSQGVLVEVDRTENRFVWECHSLNYLPSGSDNTLKTRDRSYGAATAGSSRMGNRFAPFAPREKTALSVCALEETHPHVGHAVFLPE